MSGCYTIGIRHNTKTLSRLQFAVNALGDSPAATVQVTTPPFAPPAPTSVSVTAGPASLSLVWLGSGSTSYTVRRSTTPGGPHSVLKSGVAMTSYVDAAGESPRSEEAFGSPTAMPPPAPTRVRATRPAPRKSVIAWKQSTGKGITRNRIYRSTSPSGPFELIADVPRRVRFNNTGLVPQVTYYYTVTAVNSQGAESARSSTVFVKKRGR